MYTHALDSATLSTSIPDYVRLDEQLIAMVQDARLRLSRMSYHMDRKIFMMGFSASGMFTSRFTAIHPEIVRAAAAGSPGGWPLAPVTVWQGIPMHYPVGILDLDTLIIRSNRLKSAKVPAWLNRSFLIDP